MTIAVEAGFRVTDTQATAESEFVIEIVEGLDAAEPLWRGFEATAVKSPFQRFDWIAAYVASAGCQDDIRIAAVRDRSGRLKLMMPLSVSSHMGCRIAAGIGGKHASFNMPLMAPGLSGAMAPGQAQSLLAEIGRALRIDAFALAGLPTSWRGEPNPFAALGRPAPDRAYTLALAATGDDTLARCMSKDGRKKLRSKERALAQLGTVSFLEARSDAEIDLVLDAFFRQKQERFRELGIRDPFLDDDVRAFVHRAARPSAAGSLPAIALFALTLDGSPLAVFGGAIDADQLAGMFISFDGGNEASKFSPGDILVSRIIRTCCERGLSGFDLGVGEARYKRTFCDREIELADVIVPLTWRGRAYASACASWLATKRRLKASPSAMRLLSALRRAKPGAGSKAESA